MKVSTDGVILGAWTNPENTNKILDIGTGTGLLALMLAQRSSAGIDAIDIDDSACRQAAENVKNSKWNEAIRVIHSSLQAYAGCGIRYDLIVSNPPYFSNSLKSDNEKRNIARHNDYLSQKDLLSGADSLLSENGRFVLILPCEDSREFIIEASMVGLYCNRKLNVKASPKKKISRVIMEFSHCRTRCEENDLVIRNEDGGCSDDYKSLTRDYYLAF